MKKPLTFQKRAGLSAASYAVDPCHVDHGQLLFEVLPITVSLIDQTHSQIVPNPRDRFFVRSATTALATTF